MTDHYLKIYPEFFQKVVDGSKTAEIRKNDRDFKVDDWLFLQEWNPDTEKYTGRYVQKKITDIIEGGNFGIEEGYTLLSLGIGSIFKVKIKMSEKKEDKKSLHILF